MATTREQLTEVLRDVFDNDTVVANDDITAAEVEGWDSMGNVRLFLAIEQEFGTRFSTGEISSIRNVGEMIALIEKKRGKS